MKETNNTSWSERVGKVHKYWTTPNAIPEYRKHMIHLIVEELEKGDYVTIMDCGCGTGLVYKYLPDKYKDRYYGIDFTQEMIDYCKVNYPEHEDRFTRMDLTDMSEMDKREFSEHKIYITQNVIQHILLFMEALDNIFDSAYTIILCERTHNLQTVISRVFPVRWRFNVKDFYDILTYYAKKHNYGDVKIMSQPKTGLNEDGMLTIYKVDFTKRNKLSDAEKDYYNEQLFIRKFMLLEEYKPPLRKKDRILRLFGIK